MSRALLLGVMGLWAGCRSPGTPPASATSVPAPRVDAAVAPVDAVAEVAVDPDRDHDHLIDRCDYCPSEPEVYNGILDEDGCPDNSGQSHAVMMHPTHEYGRPFGVVAGVALMHGDDDDLDWLVRQVGLEALACVVHVPAGTRSARALRRARDRATRACAALVARIAYPVAAVGLVTPSDLLLGTYAWGEVELAVVVTNAQGVEVWRWTGADFERGEPPATLRQRPPMPGCE